MFEDQKHTPLLKVEEPFLREQQIELWVKRDDLIHPEVSGNKWRKLKYNLIEAQKQGFHTVLTFGGAYSNHIAATAVACKSLGIESIGIIRGDELNKDSNPTLQKAFKDGMQLIFVGREQYKLRTEQSWLEQLQIEHSAFIIPEGGSNSLAAKGVSELLKEIDIDFDLVTCAVGTGGTLAGITQKLKPHQDALGFAALKGEKYLHEEVSKLTDSRQWNIIHNYHFGGYAKYTTELVEFIQSFYQTRQIPLDHIYTGKMMFGLYQMIREGKIKGAKKIIALHTGGLQGSNLYKEGA